VRREEGRFVKSEHAPSQPARLPRLTRPDLPAKGQAVWDHIAGTRPGVPGPYQTLIRVPELATVVADVGKVLRFEGTLSDADRELATIATARCCGEDFEWRMHLPLALKGGVPQSTVDVLLRDGPTDSLKLNEKVIIDIARAITTKRAVDDELYARARELFGESGLIELVSIVGFYSMLAAVLCTFGVPD
jgi:4-carboxymuconolactone decarboxylase